MDIIAILERKINEFTTKTGHSPLYVYLGYDDKQSLKRDAHELMGFEMRQNKDEPDKIFGLKIYCVESKNHIGVGA